MKHSEIINGFVRRAEKWALANPGQTYRKTVIRDNAGRFGGLSLVSRAEYEETCIESEYVGEVFAIKEPGQAVYAVFSAN